MELAFNIERLFVVILIVMSNGFTYYFAANRINNKIKQSEDKIWEYLKLRDITKPTYTSSGLTRKF